MDSYRNHLEKSRDFWYDSAESERAQSKYSRLMKVMSGIGGVCGSFTFLAERQTIGAVTAATGLAGYVMFGKLAENEEIDALSCELQAIEVQLKLDELDKK